MKPILFLDIDGVLNRYASKEPIEPDCVERLNQIVESTGAGIVITSSWREWFTPWEMQQLLDTAGFRGDVIGETPILLGQPRGAEIRAYLKDEPACRFAILDDNPDLEGVEDHAVMTDEFEGVSDADVLSCIAMLNNGIR